MKSKGSSGAPRRSQREDADDAKTDVGTAFTPDQIRAGERLFARPWSFLKGVADLDGLPPANRPEIALAGRSNTGKSSLINALARQRDLARTSNAPGRTQEINFFAREDVPLYLVDLPGYGFACAPKDKVEAWTKLVLDYLAGRETLARVLLLVDARHGLKTADSEAARLMDQCGVLYQVVLTKADKLNPGAVEAQRVETTRALERHPAAFPEVLATSAMAQTGIAELRATIAGVLSERRIGVARGSSQTPPPSPRRR